MKLSVTTGPTDDIQDIKIGTVSIDPPNILAAATGDIAVTVNGLDAASMWNVIVSPTSSLSSGITVGGAWVSADNQITVQFVNPTILAINQGVATFSYVCIKYIK